MVAHVSESITESRASPKGWSPGEAPHTGGDLVRSRRKMYCGDYECPLEQTFSISAPAAGREA